MSNPPKSLAAKMAAIMNDVPTMIRNGQNQQQKYLYVTAEDVKASIRPLMSKHKVAMFANMLDVQRETSINRNQTLVVTVIAKMCFTLVCGETGEQMECIWFGEANDYADKAEWYANQPEKVLKKQESNFRQAIAVLHHLSDLAYNYDQIEIGGKIKTMSEAIYSDYLKKIGAAKSK